MSESLISEMLSKIDEHNNENTHVEQDSSHEKVFKKGFVDNSKTVPSLFDELEKEEAQPPKIIDFRIGSFIILLLILIVNISAILSFLFDVGQIRTSLTTAYNNKVYNEELAALQEQIDRERSTLEQEKEKLEQAKSELLAKKDELSKKEEELNLLQQEVDGITPVMEQGNDPTELSEEEAAKIADAAKIYEQMDAKRAAQIIVSLDMDHKVRIIQKMKKEKAAEILSAMDASQSSSIMREMLKSKGNNDDMSQEQ